jgi:hypothetical protein
MSIEYSPIEAEFTVLNNAAYFDPFPSNLATLNEQFSSESPFTFTSESSIGTHSVSSNQMTINGSGTRNTIVYETGVGPSIPQLWVEMQIDSGGTSSAGYDNFGVGIVKDSNNFLFASLDRIGKTARIQIKIGGSNTFYASVSASTYTAPYKIALSLVGNSACFWRHNGSTWSCITKYDVTAKYDFQTIGNLTGWYWGFTVATNNTSTWILSNLKAGSYGAVGLRDMTVVTEENGDPYMVDAETIKFLASASDPNGYCYSGIFTLNISTYAITQVGLIFINRDGKYYRDHAGHIIYYSNGNRRLFMTTWANGFGGSVQILYKLLTTGDVLSGVTVIDSMTQLTLPGLLNASYGAYDPFCVWDGSQWLLTYSITANTNFTGNPFYPALASSDDLATFDLIGADTAMSGTGYEGTRLTRSNDDWWVLAGGPKAHGNVMRVYDSSMNYVGNIDAVLDDADSYPPHAMIFSIGQIYYMLTWDSDKYGSVLGTRGSPLIERSYRYSSIDIEPDSINSDEEFGNPSFLWDAIIEPESIESSEAFGTPSFVFDGSIYPTSIESDEAFGIPEFTVTGMPPSEMKKVFDVLLPPGAIWRPQENSDFDHLLNGMGSNAQENFDFIDALAHIRDPRETPILDDLEKEYGITKNTSLTEAERRVALAAAKYAIPNTASWEHLQDRLRAAGFANIVVTPNDPAIDPSLIASSDLVVNGTLYSSQSPAYLAECNGDETFAGNGKAVCGYYISIRHNNQTYQIPTAYPYWRFFFFVGGAASGWPSSPAIAYYTVQAGRLDELKRLILRYKPVRAWCVLRAGY